MSDVDPVEGELTLAAYQASSLGLDFLLRQGLRDEAVVLPVFVREKKRLQAEDPNTIGDIVLRRHGRRIDLVDGIDGRFGWSSTWMTQAKDVA
jgi:hypothetical protein